MIVCVTFVEIAWHRLDCLVAILVSDDSGERHFSSSGVYHLLRFIDGKLSGVLFDAPRWMTICDVEFNALENG